MPSATSRGSHTRNPNSASRTGSGRSRRVEHGAETGLMALRVYIEVSGADDVDLVACVEKWRGKRYVAFEGSYGFGRDRVTTGWQRASLRALNPLRARPFEPVPTFDRPQLLRPGEVVPIDIALGPSATLFRAGEQLRLVIAGRWLWPHNILTGQFPAAYEPGPRGRCTLHWGTWPRFPPARPGYTVGSLRGSHPRSRVGMAEVRQGGDRGCASSRASPAPGADIGPGRPGFSIGPLVRSRGSAAALERAGR